MAIENNNDDYYRTLVECLVFDEKENIVNYNNTKFIEDVNNFINWCKEEYCHYEGCDIDDLINCLTPLDYANKVYWAWTDYYRDLGMLD